MAQGYFLAQKARSEVLLLGTWWLLLSPWEHWGQGTANNSFGALTTPGKPGWNDSFEALPTLGKPGQNNSFGALTIPGKSGPSNSFGALTTLGKPG